MTDEDKTTEDEVTPKSKTTAKKSSTRKTTTKKAATKKTPPKSAVKKSQTKADADSAADVIESKAQITPVQSAGDADDSSKTLVKMESGFAYVTGSGVRFSQDHPFQLVSEAEAFDLVQQERFRPASKDEVKSFYKSN